jgi:hypothetical protein
VSAEPRPFVFTTRRVKTTAGRERTERGLELRFHEGQQRTYDSTARIVAMISGTQGGKTCMGPWWLRREIGDKGPGDYLAVTATYDLFKVKMLPTILEVYVHTLGIARYWAGDQILELCDHTFDETSKTWIPQPGVFRARQATDPMWARIILRSASSEGGLESATAKAAWLDEAGLEEFGLGAWEAIMRRLSLHRGRILITTTPYNNVGWLKREVFDRWRAGDPQIDVIQFKSISNPAFPKEEFDERQRHMPGWKFKMFYEGQFERPAGLIYPDYDDGPASQGGMIVEPFAIPSGWRRVLGVDPGPVHYALLWGAIDPATDTLFLVKERLESYRSTQEIARDVMIDQGSGQPTLGEYYVGGTPDVQPRLDWEMAGAHPVFEPPFRDVESGIDRGTLLLRQNRVRVFSTLMATRDEFLSYRRKLDDQGLPTEDIEDKSRFHFMDAFRYIAAGITYVRIAVRVVAPQVLQLYRGDAL